MRYQCNIVYHDIIRTYNEQSFSFIFQALRACSNFDFDFAQTWNQSKHYNLWSYIPICHIWIVILCVYEFMQIYDYVSPSCFKNVFLSSLWTTSKSFLFYNWKEGRYFHLVSWQFRAVWSRPSCSCDFVNKGESARPPQPQTGKGKTRKRTFRSQIMWNQSWNF